MQDILRSEEVVHQTVATLSMRISERFPDSGLWKVSQDLLESASDAHTRAKWIARPLVAIRIVAAFLIVAMLAIIISIFIDRPFDSVLSFKEFVGVFEAGINVLVLVGISVFFLISFERRVKRIRALKAIQELRAIAHVIDMHQLTKDPDRILGQVRKTASEPERMSATNLGRYLDFCSELLALVGKVAALYTQHLNDLTAIASVNEVETLTTGLSRKIWQKILVLHSFRDPPSDDPSDA